jgi:hypothetical protein
MTSANGTVISEIADRAQRLALIRRALARSRGQIPKPAPAGFALTAAGVVPRPATAGPKSPVRMGVKEWRSAVSDLPTAVHEAAHACIAVVAGAEIDRAEVFPPGAALPDGGRGYCRYMPFGIEAEQRKPLIWAAGAVAEAILLHGRAPTRAQVDALLAVHGTDGEELRRLAFAAGTVPNPLAVLPLALKAWPAISELAVKLDIAGVIHHRDVTAALGLSKDKGLHGFELANIRAGLRDVPGKRSR